MNLKSVILLPIIFFALTPCFSQNKKEQILILNYRIDSMLQVLSKEREQMNIEEKRLNRMIAAGRKKSDSLSTLLLRANNDIQQKENRIADQVKIISEYRASQNTLKLAIRQKADSLTEMSRQWQLSQLKNDSLSALVNSLREEKTAGSVKPEELLKLTRNNLQDYSVEDLRESMDNLKETRFYEDTRSTEFGVYEKTIGRLVFVRGFVSSGCGDCYGVVLNYYTADGFLFYQLQSDACAVEPASSYTTIGVRYEPNSTLKAFEIYNGMNEQPNFESIKTSAGTLKNFRGVPTGYKATGTVKPPVFECISVRGVE